MSTGVVVCSVCRREVHQDLPLADERFGWRHCEDKTPRCDGATHEYPAAGEPLGEWCGVDGTPDEKIIRKHGLKPCPDCGKPALLHSTGLCLWCTPKEVLEAEGVRPSVVEWSERKKQARQHEVLVVDSPRLSNRAAIGAVLAMQAMAMAAGMAPEILLASGPPPRPVNPDHRFMTDQERRHHQEMRDSAAAKIERRLTRNRRLLEKQNGH